ncbi:hypothetical protein D3C72_1315890 [compost metagenome]
MACSVRGSEWRRYRIRLPSISSARTGSLRVSSCALARVLYRKCGSTCACNRLSLATVSSFSVTV